MTNNGNPNNEGQRPASLPDLPLIIEQLQNQLEDLTAALRAQQVQLDRLSARVAALERT